MTNLDPIVASRICREQCRARCCRGPQYLRLSAAEVVAFEAHGRSLGVAVIIERNPDGSGALGYLEHPGEHCPMLDDASSTCRIYAQRPERCRAFPEGPRPGCAISGADPAD